MTFAPAADAPAPATEEMAVLLMSARQASRALRQHPRPEVSTASQIAQALSDDISGTARLIGVDTTEGWRLLDLRDRLDSHVLAVTALDGTGVRDDVVLDLIGRAVIDLVVNLRQ